MKLKIRKRSEWEARDNTKPYLHHKPNKITIHHSYKPLSKCKGDNTIRSIQYYHMDINNWIDIGYHYIIDADGVMYEGRPINVLGAHCNPNNGKVGILVIGNFDREIPSKKALQSLKELCQYICTKYNIDTNNIKGHRDYTNKKTCPGKNLYNELENIRSL